MYISYHSAECCITAGETLPDIVYTPTSKMEMVSNVEQVIAFMKARNIRMHETFADGKSVVTLLEASYFMVLTGI